MSDSEPFTLLDDSHSEPQNISTEPSNMEQYDDGSDCRQKAIYVRFICVCTLTAFGASGNLFSFVVLHLRYPLSTANFYLKALAIADTTFLLSWLVQSLLEYYNVSETGTWPYVLARFYLMNILTEVPQFISVWLIVALSFSRFIAVAKPLSTNHYLTRKRMWISLFAIKITAVVLSIVRLSITTKCDPSIAANQTHYRCYVDNLVPWIYYTSLVYFSGFLFILPAIPLLVFNIGLIVALTKHRRERAQNMPPLAPEFHDITKTVLVIVGVFFISYLPFLVHGLITTVRKFRDYFYYHACANGIIYNVIIVGTLINSSVNYLIYLFCKKSFKDRCLSLMTSQSSRTNGTPPRKVNYECVPTSDSSSPHRSLRLKQETQIDTAETKI